MSTTVRIAVVFHSGYGQTAKQAEAGAVIAAVDAAVDAVVFGAPTYMGAASAAFKKFAETTSAPWGDGMHWKNKVAGGFTNSQNVNAGRRATAPAA